MNESKTALLNASKSEFSVIIPCLDEADTLGTCLEKLQAVAKNENFELEVIVADNGSTDDSQKIAENLKSEGEPFSWTLTAD